MGYNILTTAELNATDLSNITINGSKIVAVPRTSNDGLEHILEGDNYNQYTLQSILDYINSNITNWSPQRI